jgi:uncharacterized membrane protein YqjE
MSMRTPNERTVPDVLHDIIGNIQEILRSEFQLAKTEIKEEVGEASAPAVTLGMGVVLALYAVGLLLLALVYGLAMHMAMWSAALLVGVSLALVAILLINWGLERLKRVNAKSERTIASLKENVLWAKKQIE